MIDLFRFLHVLSISLWIGAALWIPGDIRRTVALGRPHVDALARRVEPALGLDTIAGIATVLTGIGLLVAEGVARPRLGIVAGFVLALVRLGVLTAVRSRFVQLVDQLRHASDVAPHEATVRRIGMLSGIAHTLWLLALAAMVFPL